MSDTTVDVATREATGLMVWLRFDESRVPEVEAAYDTYISTAQPGVYGFVGSIAGGIAWYIVWGSVHRVSRLDAAALGSIVSTLVTYGIFLASISRCPRDVVRTMLKGCVDVRRACAFAAIVALPIALAETVIIALLYVPVSHTVSHALPYFVLFQQAYALALAPIGEEFFFQGWLQTRLRGTGTLAAPVLTTVLFVLFHGPRQLSQYVRGIGLGFNAYLRASTRSLGACIVAHAANNLYVMAFGAAIALLWPRHP